MWLSEYRELSCKPNNAFSDINVASDISGGYVASWHVCYMLCVLIVSFNVAIVINNLKLKLTIAGI